MRQRRRARILRHAASRPSPHLIRALAAEIGSIREECTDHILALGEGHPRRVLRDYAEYDKRSRCPLSLRRHSPEPREVESGRGAVLSVTHIGGLHHRYLRAA